MLHPYCFRCFSKKLDYTGPVGSGDDINRRIIPSVIARFGHYLNCFMSPIFKKKKLPFREINDPSETLLSFLRPSNSLVSVSYPTMAFRADTVSFKGSRLASCVASRATENQGNQQVSSTWPGGLRTPSTTVDAKLDFAWVC